MNELVLDTQTFSIPKVREIAMRKFVSAKIVEMR